MRRTVFILGALGMLSVIMVIHAQTPSGIVLFGKVTPSLPNKHVDFSLIATHDPDSPDFNSNCTACHGNRLDEEAPLSDLPAFHGTMEFLGADDQRCLWRCHQMGADLLFRTTAHLRADVYAGFSCASSACHGVNGPVPFYAVDD